MFPDIKIIRGIHPGLLLERELKIRKIRKSQLASELGISSGIITDISKQRRAITPSMSIRLGHFFGIPEDYFLLLQAYYLLKQVKEKLVSQPDLRLRPAIFWDIEFKNLDYEHNKNFIIIRVFERGNQEEIQNIIEYYGNELVTQIIKEAKSLLFTAIENGKKYLGITENDFKCLQNSKRGAYFDDYKI